MPQDWLRILGLFAGLWICLVAFFGWLAGIWS